VYNIHAYQYVYACNMRERSVACSNTFDAVYSCDAGFCSWGSIASGIKSLTSTRPLCVVDARALCSPLSLALLSLSLSRS